VKTEIAKQELREGVLANSASIPVSRHSRGETRVQWQALRDSDDSREGQNQIRFRGLILDRLPRSALGRGEKVRNRSPGLPGRRSEYILKGLILAQNERWRRGLGMQVERIPPG
jgi:hypothetical protein